MIGEFENTLVKTGYPNRNVTDRNKIDTLYLTGTDFVFSTETTFETYSQWIADIKAGNISVLRDMQEVDPAHEATEYNKSRFDYEYRGKKGKFVFTFRTIYEPEYHEHIKALSGQNLRVFMGDVNNNMLASLSGANVRGMDIELIEVEEKAMIGGTDPSWTVIRIVLSDPTEYNLTTKMDWNINQFDLIHVTLSSISGSGSYIDFTVKDSTFGIEINSLYLGDLTITDDAGGITATNLTERSCGTYRITASAPLTTGSIDIDSDRFYGSGDYVVSDTNVTFSNYAFEAVNKFQVDVRTAGLGTLYTGLVLADFTLVDDTNGAVTIASVNEVSTGRYEIITGTNLTTGDIDVDDGTVTGAGNYDVEIGVTVSVFTPFVGSETFLFDIKVINTANSSNITTLIQPDFSISDNLNGALTINQFTNSGSGFYQIQVTGGSITTGTIAISSTLYSGSYSYSIVGATFKNCGASDTTDFINATGGLAERWGSARPAGMTPTIETGVTGFTGNVQKFVKIDALSAGTGINCLSSYFKNGTQYKLRFKYRSNNTGSGSDRYIGLLLYGSGTYVSENVDISSGFYTLYESSPFVPSGETFLALSFTITKYLMEVYLDEIELIEV